jgi:hypothetical protein
VAIANALRASDNQRVRSLLLTSFAALLLCPTIGCSSSFGKAAGKAAGEAAATVAVAAAAAAITEAGKPSTHENNEAAGQEVARARQQRQEREAEELREAEERVRTKKPGSKATLKSYPQL